MNGRHAATWRTSPTRGQELTYDEAWLADPHAAPISRSMPIVPGGAYRGDVVANYFENLLPENRAIRERLRERFHARSTGAFDLLQQIGRDCVGAVQLVPEGAGPQEAARIEVEPLTQAQVAHMLREAAGMPVRGLGGHDDAAFRISLPGMQEKAGVVRHRDRWCRPLGGTPTTHILKLPLGVGPSGIDLTTSVWNEWLCSEIVRALGVEVARGTVQRFQDLEVLAVERFDRRAAARGTRIERVPQEDFCQATGTPAQGKYESDGGPGIARIMRELGGAIDPHTDRLRFMRMQVVFWLLCAIDGHAKNFSIFLEPAGRYRLAPAYDVLSAYPFLGAGPGKISPEKVRLSMAFWGVNRHYRWVEVRRSHIVKTARDCGLARDIEALLEEIVALAPGAIEQVGRALPRRFPHAVAEPILEGTLAAAKRLAG